MEFIAHYFMCDALQCWFVDDWTYTSNECCDYRWITYQECTNAPLLVPFRDYCQTNGFFLKTRPGGGTILGPLSAEDAKSEICASTQIMAVFAPNDPMDSGHVATMTTFDDSDPNSEYWLFQLMDPARGFVSPTYRNLFNGAFEAGSWGASLLVYYVDCPSVGIADIAGFWYDGQHEDSIYMKARLSHTANPADSMALYVSDNPWGPVRRVQTWKPISAPPPSEGTVVNVVDSDRNECCSMDYYYYIDHGYGNFGDLRDPLSLENPVLANMDNPIPFNYMLFNRDTLVVPVVDANDAPLDFGGVVDLAWTLSEDDTVLDYYNIYRRLPGENDYRWITEVPGGTDSYTDSSVVLNGEVSYVVSSAHHGYGDLCCGPSSEGIWNDFSEPATTISTNNYESFIFELACDDTLVMCPQGDVAGVLEDTLRVAAVLLGSDGNPTVGAPEEMLCLYAMHDGACFCAGDTASASSATNGGGETEFMIPRVGGHGSVDLVSGIAGTYFLKDTVSVVVKSPDFNGNGTVDILDFDAFGLAYNAECGDSNYTTFLDFNGDCTIKSLDFTCFGNHFGHNCGGGGGQASSSQLASSAGTINVVLQEDYPLQGARKLRAELWVNDVEPYRSLVAILRNENPALRFSEWHPDPGYKYSTMATAVDKRVGVPEIVIGVVGGSDVATRSTCLGYVEMDVLSTEPLEITERDLGLVDARLLEIDGTARGFAASQASLTQQPAKIVDALAQNYPNPFNPTTTISYSIADPSYVQLRVYNVRGQLVKTLVDEDQVPNVYRRIWDGRNSSGDSVASGIYFYRLIVGDFAATKKMVLIR
jgi:hypothetical protein